MSNWFVVNAEEILGAEGAARYLELGDRGRADEDLSEEEMAEYLALAKNLDERVFADMEARYKPLPEEG